MTPSQSRGVRVRSVVPDDVASYVALRREMLRAEPWAFAASEDADVGCDEAKMRERLAEPGQALIGAFEAQGAGEALIGAAGVLRNRHAKMAHRATIWGVYVTPRARGLGVGAALIGAVLDVAKSWPGVDSVGLCVSARGQAAQRLYARMGFVAWGCEPGAMVVDGVAYDEVHMLRRLA